MNDLKKLINQLSPEEKKLFITHLEKRNKRHDTKNVSLFKLLDTSTYNKSKNSLYKTTNTTAYNALKKRVYDNLIDFIIKNNFERNTSKETDSLKLTLAAQSFIERKLPEIAFKILKKAEIKALKVDSFKVLNEIYETQIQYAYLYPNIPLEAIIFKYQNNKKKLIQEEQLNLGYAYLRKQLNSINSHGKVIDFQEVINQTINRFNISFKDTLTYRSLYQIMFITNEYAHLNNDYYSIESYALKSYSKILLKEAPSEKNRHYHIHILYFMANVFFRNRKFERSIFYLEKMLAQINCKKAKYHPVFFSKYALLKSLVENYSGNYLLAIATANNALNIKNANDFEEINSIRLALTIFHFQKSNFKEAITIFKIFNHTDTWYEKRFGIDWCIKKNLIEILLHIELQNIDYVSSKITSFKRRYTAYLNSKKKSKIIHFFKLVEYYFNNPELVISSKFKNDFNALENSITKDIFIISFYAWLKSKIQKTDLFETTLKMVNNNDH